MKSMKAAVTMMAMTIAIALVGCAKPPTTELTGAKDALSAAQKAEASVYAASQLDEAKQAVDAAEAEVAAQDGKFAMTRNYDKAKQLITDATTKAKEAEDAAVKGKEEAKKKAEDALASVNTAMTSVDAMMDHLKTCPKKPKGFDADMTAMQGQVDALKAEVAPIQQSIAGNDFNGAVSRAEALQQQITTVTTDLSGAMDKIKCPMPAPAAAPAAAPSSN
jgi:chromosome segregation ATPase